MTDYENVDYFTDPSLVTDPFPYFDYLRQKCPVTHLPQHNVVAVTGFDEAVEVFRDPETFSACNSVTGPFPGLPVPPEGDDASQLIDKYRHQLPLGEYLPTQDPPVHTAQRGLLMRLLTPKRMRENEEFMWRLADRQIDEFIADGRFEVLSEFSQPLALLVIADLLGVPEEDHQAFKSQLGTEQPAPDVGGEQRAVSRDPLAFLFDTFTAYVEDRRREPRNDVLTQMATATYPDGTTPEVPVVVRTAVFLFAAGHHTTAQLIASSLRFLVERPELQQQLRSEREHIPQFIHEVLRLDGPVKHIGRMARVTTSVAGVDIPAGTTVSILPGGANRDPRRFEDPNELEVDRPKTGTHVAFGWGIHTCPGSALAQTEARVALERLFDRTAAIRISEAEHGPPGDRRFEYTPTYILRDLKELHLEFDPVK